jgi:hypothetical protein
MKEKPFSEDSVFPSLSGLQDLLALQKKCQKEKESWSQAKRDAFTQGHPSSCAPSCPQSYYKIFHYTF